MVLIDIGVIIDHYASDMTRTLFFGTKDPKLEKIYNIVTQAKETVLKLCRPGISVGELDQAAREIFQKEEVEQFYLHSLGHGIGLEVHEPPIMKHQGKYSSTKLQENMVITVEPGLYLPKKGGVRIEEMIQISKEGFESYLPLENVL
jgi:Xaa-Pro aminopeptidase